MRQNVLIKGIPTFSCSIVTGRGDLLKNMTLDVSRHTHTISSDLFLKFYALAKNFQISTTEGCVSLGIFAYFK